MKNNQRAPIALGLPSELKVASKCCQRPVNICNRKITNILGKIWWQLCELSTSTTIRYWRAVCYTVSLPVWRTQIPFNEYRNLLPAVGCCYICLVQEIMWFEKTRNWLVVLGRVRNAWPKFHGWTSWKKLKVGKRVLVLVYYYDRITTTGNR